MKLIKSGNETYKSWIGLKFTCNVTGNEYQLEESDVAAAVEAKGGAKIDHVNCPDCKQAVKFASDQREGIYLVHTYLNDNYR